MEYGKYAEVEARIRKALTALADEPDLTVMAAADQFHVPVRRLRARHQGRKARSQREGSGQRLTKQQHRALEAYVQRCDNLHMPALVPQLIDAAQRILSLSLAPGQNAEPLTRNWISRYLKKYPHMRRVKQKTKEIDRSASEEIAVYQRHFRDFHREVEEKGILLDDIYNMDETGFRIGVSGSQWVITMDMNRPQFNPSDTNRDYATSIEAVSGDGVMIDPMLIMKGVNHLKK